MSLPNLDRLPADIRSTDRWVIWRFETRPDRKKPTKVPYERVSTLRESIGRQPRDVGAIRDSSRLRFRWQMRRLRCRAW